MHTHRFAVAATVLLTLCGTAGAETMDKTKSDPFAVPVSGKGQTGERAAVPWTPERRAGAEATQTPDVDPAAARAAAVNVRSGGQAGPEGGTAAVLASAEAPMGAHAGPAGERSATYWTGERRAEAEATATPDVDPAAARAAAVNVRSGSQAGPEGGTPAMTVASGWEPIGSQVAPEGERKSNYWTPDRMRKAKPLAIPTIPGDGSDKPGAKNR